MQKTSSRRTPTSPKRLTTIAILPSFAPVYGSMITATGLPAPNVANRILLKSPAQIEADGTFVVTYACRPAQTLPSSQSALPPPEKRSNVRHFSLTAGSALNAIELSSPLAAVICFSKFTATAQVACPEKVTVLTEDRLNRPVG